MFKYKSKLVEKKDESLPCNHTLISLGRKFLVETHVVSQTSISNARAVINLKVTSIMCELIVVST